MKSVKIFLAVFSLPLSVFCQDITGLWTGTIYNDSTRQVYQYEIGISQEKGKYTGFSHTWFTIDNNKYFGVKKVSVKIAGNGKIIIVDGELLSNNYPVQPNKDVRQLNILSLEKNDGQHLLSGPFVTNRTKEFSPLTGQVSLKRQNDFSQSDLVPHLQKIRNGQDISINHTTKEQFVKMKGNNIPHTGIK